MCGKVRSSSELQAICLRRLKACPGFERVSEILIQPRDARPGGTNWILAAVRPRVDNDALRGARATIDHLQRSYRLETIAVQPDKLESLKKLSAPAARRAPFEAGGYPFVEKSETDVL